MNLDIKKHYWVIWDFLYSIKLFIDEYETIVYSIIAFMGSCIISILSGDYSEIVVYIVIISLIILILSFVYYRVWKYVPIFLIGRDYSINLIDPPNLYCIFKTESLMLDNIFSTSLLFKMELNQCFKNNIEKTRTDDGTYYYTLVVKKDKLVTVDLPSEYINEDVDLFCEERNVDYYYIVQEYRWQSELEFIVNFSCTNNININNSISVYLEYGDIHKDIEVKNLKNKVFDDEFFKTDLSSLKR